jgi:hypothetical protein
MRALERGVMFGLLGFYLCSTVLFLILLNPPPDRQASQLVANFFAPSYLILAVWAGYGLILSGTFLARERTEQKI